MGNQVDPSTQPDSLDTSTDVQSIPPKLYMWQLSETLGNRTIVPADTLSLNFQNTNLVDGMTGQYNFLATSALPRLSRIFFDRESTEPTIFMTPFSSFFVRPDQVFFTNSNVPYTNLTYYKAGNKVNGEERFKSYFSVNVNKRLAFGFTSITCTDVDTTQSIYFALQCRHIRKLYWRTLPTASCLQQLLHEDE